MIKKLNRNLIDFQSTSVYDFNELTLQDLLCKFFYKINNCIDVSNQALSFLEWLKEEGLPIEVQKEIEKMYLDGRLTEIINKLADNVNEKVDNVVLYQNEKPLSEYNKVWVEDITEEVLGDLAYADKEIDRVTNKLNEIDTTVSNKLETFGSQLEQKANKNEIGTPLVASSVSEMLDKSKVYVNTTDGNWYSWSGTEWKSGGVYNSQGIGLKSVGYEHTNFLNIKTQYCKEVNKTNGYYWSWKLVKTANSGYIVYEPIQLKKGVYNISRASVTFTYLKDSDGVSKDLKTFLSISEEKLYTGILTLDKDYTIYITTYFNAHANAVSMLVNGDELPNYYVEDNYIISIDDCDLKQISNTLNKVNNQFIKINEINVKKDGSGDFISIVEAVKNITDSSGNNIYNINIYDGTYNIIEELGGNTFLASITSESSELSGLLLPDYVNLIGKGSNVLLEGAITSEKATLVLTTKISTLNINKTNIIENITVTARNLRYAIHDESSNKSKNYKRIMNNVKAIHFGNDSGMWSSCVAVACGAGDGAEYEYNNCYFEGVQHGYSIHDNTELFIKGNKVVFNNCSFARIIPDSSGGCISFQTSNKNNNCKAILNNCRLNAQIHVDTQNGAWVVEGSGNTPTQCRYTDMVRFTDETAYYYNEMGVTIPKGTPLKMYNGRVYKIAKWTEKLFNAVALEDIPINSKGLCKISGWIHKDYTRMESITPNTNITITNEVFAQGDTNVVAIAYSDTYIKLLT